ncbi:cytochrome P450 [Aspergillus pseudonomiae]|uniref:Cytochrome P450 n=1 Tax=Aspergillus pseudonomiae TaxID=1506151 RepID=A0A5N6IAS4_9EURO|nr:cytochrome P450 [Aspergillus pseudonomiae]KAB8263675.1 cytochrome P450 [Aspergillus pseudonomiae]KAE8408541.1 cytochrome P450 [Aspergillus pseudonomiae]
MLLDLYLCLVLIFILGVLGVHYVAGYVKRWHLHDIPGPTIAGFSRIWLILQVRQGHRSIVVHDLHTRYGKIVRLAPNHISVADESAIQAIYGHGNGFLKSDFYNAFLNVDWSVFTTRSRAEHTRKRKIVSHAFSARSLAQVEQYAHNNMELLVRQWRKMIDSQASSDTRHAVIDARPWCNYLTFDIIGDLAFGAPFGMLERGDDTVSMRRGSNDLEVTLNAVEVLNHRSDVSATLGIYPDLIPYAKWLPDPFFRQGAEAIADLADVARATVDRRLDMEVSMAEKRGDLLAHLIDAEDQAGAKLGHRELTGEAVTLIAAGSDTSSSTLCALLYWVSSTPRVLWKLQLALDEAIPADVDVPYLAMVKKITYLQWVIWETLRIHSTFGQGLPRQVPPDRGPVEICGHTFYPGDVLSIPGYTMHHGVDIWGTDVEDFVPERWDPCRLTRRQKESFIPFSHGPRACIGRNLAEMELFVACATLFRLFDIRVERQGPLEVREGWLRKPVSLQVGIRHRYPDARSF